MLAQPHSWVRLTVRRMEIFGVPVYFNFLSLTSFVPALLGTLGAIFISLIRSKSQNSWSFFFALLSMGIFQAAYGEATSIFQPIGAFHRWQTVFFLFIMISFIFRFMMTYSENPYPKSAKYGFYLYLFSSPIIALWFAIQTLRLDPTFRSSGQFWDFEDTFVNVSVSLLILLYSAINLAFCFAKFFKMQNRQNARTFMILIIAMSVYNLPGAYLNNLWRRGAITAEFHLWFMAIGITSAFFIMFVIFLSHTFERSTVIGNLLGITLVSMLILFPFLGYPLIEDRKASFRDIWKAKLQAGLAPSPDKSIVLFAPSRSHRSRTVAMGERSYFRDSAEYYEKAIQQIPSDGVILRADAKGGVYTFPVELVEPAEATRGAGNGHDLRERDDVTRHTGNPPSSTAKKIYLVGIELVELRKYIHPTAAKLVLAQFVVILVIVSLFPLFFRGILLNPMRRLLDGVIAISRGRYGHRIENARSDELGVISRHFDKMAVTIEASTVKLEDTVAQRTAQLTEEKKKSDTLLLNILPERIAEELKEKGHTQPVRIDSATVLFTDFVGFTKISESMSPEDVVAELDKCFSYFDQVTEKYGLEKLKTIGDSFMCAGGVPEANRTHAIDACLAALEIQAFMNQMKEIKHQQGFPYWELRLGINSGPLVAGVVGHKKFAYDVWGDTVNTASRMESSGLAGEINISQSTYDLVKKWFVCEHRGQVSAKNKGQIDMYLLKRIRPEYCADSAGRVPSEKMKKEYVSVRMGRL
jgi:class 3 adenylate cyclase/HAMP domain-containing protein